MSNTFLFPPVSDTLDNSVLRIFPFQLLRSLQNLIRRPQAVIQRLQVQDNSLSVLCIDNNPSTTTTVITMSSFPTISTRCPLSTLNRRVRAEQPPAMSEGNRGCLFNNNNCHCDNLRLFINSNNNI